MTAGLSVLALDGRQVDGDLYLSVDHWAQHLPAPVRGTIAAFSAYGLGLLAVLMLAGWWRARRGDGTAMARALAAPLCVVVAFAADTLLKGVLREPRPCQVLPAAPTPEACPGTGDWALPSNHTVIVFAGAAVLWLVDRRIGAMAAVLAVAMGASRVVAGVHYPHDVVLGAVVGSATGLALGLLAARAGTVVERLGRGPLRWWTTA
ncbi:phosphatase PAP2 family protein [Kitasatospora sp. CM 4170]|uniref:Phosphatase PAP2 family protein n=1 Tax=Kitasatospora aburaviensis TaxID=67265 RepID=A0ABW1F5C0_9ACTN|nr:phosphatase PAP2 family protein [Kitasatospora sp. CM 4170]WNM49269.1 phosphatase PAP2 family protein [Kitasatospora sp. CM 4170]